MNSRIDELMRYFDRLDSIYRSGYKCEREIAECIEHIRGELGINYKPSIDEVFAVYRRELRSLCGDNFIENAEKFYLTNYRIFHEYAYGNGDVDLVFDCCSGVTTSIKALERVFKDVVYLTPFEKKSNIDLTNKVVFTEGNVEIPKGTKPRRRIRITQRVY